MLIFGPASLEIYHLQHRSGLFYTSAPVYVSCTFCLIYISALAPSSPCPISVSGLIYMTSNAGPVYNRLVSAAVVVLSCDIVTDRIPHTLVLSEISNTNCTLPFHFSTLTVLLNFVQHALFCLGNNRMRSDIANEVGVLFFSREW